MVFTGRPPATSPFAGQSKLKLVTHCGSSPGAQQYELLEYAAYRMLNQLTPRSFRVRLANIDYRDGNGRPMITRYGFFIEDLKDVARRNGTKPSHGPERIPANFLNPTDAARYALFRAHDRQSRLVDARGRGGQGLLPQCGVDWRACTGCGDPHPL